MALTESEFVDHYPQLYHLTDHSAWPSIQLFGLESTTALLDRFGITGETRHALEACRRPERVVLQHPEFGQAILQDQRPLHPAGLARCLVDLTPSQWCQWLNRQVFFWPTWQRLDRLLHAKQNRCRPQCVLILDSAKLLQLPQPIIRLCPINSGNTTRNAVARGRNTFVPLADYPFADWSRRRTRQTAVAEVTIDYRLLNVSAFLNEVVEYAGTKSVGRLWPNPSFVKD